MTNEEENKDVRTISELLNSIKVSLAILPKIQNDNAFTSRVKNEGQVYLKLVERWISETIGNEEYRETYEMHLIQLLSTVQSSILIADTIDRNAKFFRQEFKYNLNKTVKSCEEVMSRFYGKHREKAKNSDCFVINDELQNVIDIYEKAVKTAFSLEHKSEEQQKAFVAEWCDLIDKHGL